jgi:hypothetical protein
MFSHARAIVIEDDLAARAKGSSGHLLFARLWWKIR